MISGATLAYLFIGWFFADFAKAVGRHDKRAMARAATFMLLGLVAAGLVSGDTQ